MDFTIVPGQTAGFELTPAPGSTVKGVPTWRSSDGEVTLTPSTDGLSCTALIPATYKSALFILDASGDSSAGPFEATHAVMVVHPGAPVATDFKQTGGQAQVASTGHTEATGSETHQPSATKHEAQSPAKHK